MQRGEKKFASFHKNFLFFVVQLSLLFNQITSEEKPLHTNSRFIVVVVAFVVAEAVVVVAFAVAEAVVVSVVVVVAVKTLALYMFWILQYF